MTGPFVLDASMTLSWAFWIAQQILLLARTYHLSAYAAAYLELAIREGLPLATLDDDLRGAASAAGVALAGAV